MVRGAGNRITGLAVIASALHRSPVWRDVVPANHHLPMNVRPLVVLGALAMLALAGCAGAAKKPVYTTGQTGVIMREQRGTITEVRDVVIEDQPLINRGGVGRQVGSAVGSAVLTGSPERALGSIGAAIGGEIGAKADKRAGEEITIRLDNDSVIIVVQERGETPLAPGERVRVVTGAPSVAAGGLGGILRGSGAGGSTRVLRDYEFVASVANNRGSARHFSQ